MRCEKHDVETYLRCGKCDRPICPQCTVFGPVGALCPDCAGTKAPRLRMVDASNMASAPTAYLAGIATAFVWGYLLAVISCIGIFQCWGGLFAGYTIGEVQLRTTGRKRNTQMELVAGITSVVGFLGALALWCVVHHMEIPGDVIDLFTNYPWYGLSLAIGIWMAINRIRHT